MHRFNLLLALSTGIVKRLIFLFDERDFAFDLLIPLGMVVLLSFLVFLFELTNFLQFCLFLDFKNGLFN